MYLVDMMDANCWLPICKQHRSNKLGAASRVALLESAGKSRVQAGIQGHICTVES